MYRQAFLPRARRWLGWTPFYLGMFFLLTGCISGVKEPDTYTDRNGKTTIIETDLEGCTRSCNNDFSRCMDAEPAQTNSGLREDPNMFGAKADCHNDLKSCLSGCNTQ